MNEIKVPQKGMKTKNSEEKYLVTSVISEENKKEYFLFSDGNLYEKDNEGNLVKLDNVSPESRKIVEKIMENFKPGKTDVIRNQNNFQKRNNLTDIDVDYPEL